MKKSKIFKPHVDAYAVNNLARTDPQRLIDLSEARYRSQISELAEDFAAHFPQSRIILLSGPTSAGKTTTSHNLDAELEKRGIATFALSLDDFFFDRDKAPLLPDGTRDFETPSLIDIETLEGCLSELLREGHADFPIYDFKLGRRSDQTFHYEYRRPHRHHHRGPPRFKPPDCRAAVFPGRQKALHLHPGGVLRRGPAGAVNPGTAVYPPDYPG